MRNETWRRGRAWREAALILVPCAGLLYLFIHFQAFDLFYQYSRAHEHLDLDELAAALVVAAIGSLFLLRRRAAALKREIRRREEAEERERELARHDVLTGLGNRRVLGETLSLWEGGRGCGALLLIDLDKFKPVNDLFGHAAGDAVLKEVAGRLRQTAPRPDLIYRLGGDEFVVLLPGDAQTREVAFTAKRVIDRLSEPYTFGNTLIEIGASVGISRCQLNSCEQGELLRSADIAMYEAKRAGAGGFCFFQSQMAEELRERADLEGALRTALQNGEVKPYFQPIIDLATDRLSGFEALARWEHPVRGLLPPSLFIPIAEDMRLIGKLSEQMLRQSCAVALAWPGNMTLSVNISPSQFLDSWFAVRLLGILASTGFPPNRLIIEVTESAILEDTAASRRTFASLHNAGVRVALDDFGKGYSSLSHLHQFAFDHLKIDSSFVLDMGGAHGEKIVNAITALGRSLGMPITAEGVETSVCAEALRNLGCNQAQGFLFGRPASAADTHRLVTAFSEQGSMSALLSEPGFSQTG